MSFVKEIQRPLSHLPPCKQDGPGCRLSPGTAYITIVSEIVLYLWRYAISSYCHSEVLSFLLYENTSLFPASGTSTLFLWIVSKDVLLFLSFSVSLDNLPFKVFVLFQKQKTKTRKSVNSRKPELFTQIQITS